MDFFIYHKQYYHVLNFRKLEIYWSTVPITNKDLLDDPNNEVPGFNAKIIILSRLESIRSYHGSKNKMLEIWIYLTDLSPRFNCGEIIKTFKISFKKVQLENSKAQL